MERRDLTRSRSGALAGSGFVAFEVALLALCMRHHKKENKRSNEQGLASGLRVEESLKRRHAVSLRGLTAGVPRRVRNVLTRFGKGKGNAPLLGPATMKRKREAIGWRKPWGDRGASCKANRVHRLQAYRRWAAWGYLSWAGARRGTFAWCESRQ